MSFVVTFGLDEVSVGLARFSSEVVVLVNANWANGLSSDIVGKEIRNQMQDIGKPIVARRCQEEQSRRRGERNEPRILV